MLNTIKLISLHFFALSETCCAFFCPPLLKDCLPELHLTIPMYSKGKQSIIATMERTKLLSGCHSGILFIPSGLGGGCYCLLFPIIKSLLLQQWQLLLYK